MREREIFFAWASVTLALLFWLMSYNEVMYGISVLQRL